MRRMLEETTYEYCVCCKTKTNIWIDEDVRKRKHYISGVGQLCEQCFFEIQTKKPSWRQEQEMRKLLQMCAQEEHDDLAKTQKIR